MPLTASSSLVDPSALWMTSRLFPAGSISVIVCTLPTSGVPSRSAPRMTRIEVTLFQAALIQSARSPAVNEVALPTDDADIDVVAVATGVGSADLPPPHAVNSNVAQAIMRLETRPWRRKDCVCTFIMAASLTCAISSHRASGSASYIRTANGPRSTAIDARAGNGFDCLGCDRDECGAKQRRWNARSAFNETFTWTAAIGDLADAQCNQRLEA